MFTVLMLLDIVALISVLGSPIVLFMSAFLNDDPNANPILVGFLQLILLLFPLTAAAVGIVGLIARKNGNLRQMAIWTAVAYSSPVALTVVLMFTKQL
jgi:hypothetical protein